MVDATGQRESAIVTTAGRHGSPVWTPDGSHLLFLVLGLDGQPCRPSRFRMGRPQALRGSCGRICRVVRSVSPPQEPSTTCRPTVAATTGYVVNRNPSAGLRPVTFPGLSASWSRSGSVAFVRNNGSELDLIIRDVASGHERTYRHPGIGVQSPRWLPDGSGVIVLVNPGGEGGSAQRSISPTCRRATSGDCSIAMPTAARVRGSAQYRSMARRLPQRPQHVHDSGDRYY